jgi:2-oxoacid:acceptor oxidoreductase delta subunit (pyruvate/2-ketoisovalerate family)
VSPKACTPPAGPTEVPKEGFSAEEAQQAAARCLANVECTHCNVCELLCPDQCIIRDPETGNILIDLNHCKGCALCAHYCPKGAIHMELEPTD